MKRFVLVAILVITVVGAGFWVFSEAEKRSAIREQLNDTNAKIAALPELEKDIFAKCMEGSSGTAQDIARCQDSTQESIHTLAQDLDSLKSDLEDQL